MGEGLIPNCQSQREAPTPTHWTEFTSSISEGIKPPFLLCGLFLFIINKKYTQTQHTGELRTHSEAVQSQFVKQQHERGGAVETVAEVPWWRF